MIITLNQKNKYIDSPEDTAKIFYAILRKEGEIDKDKEHFWAIGLDARNCIQYIELVSLGILDANLVHPRETFRLAIMKGVASLVVGHNHPSGDIEPSKADLEITARLRKAGQILGIEILDHIIIGKVGGRKYYSFKAKKLI